MARTPPPPKIPNQDKRSREHLFPQEVMAMIAAAKKVGRHPLRDSTLILMAYRHGLRVSELVALRWSQIDFTGGTIYINRLKNGVSSTHPLRGVELRALRQLQREYPNSNYLFVSERDTVMASATARGIIERAGKMAKLSLSIHADFIWQVEGMILEPSRHILVTRIFSILFAIQNCLQSDFNNFGWIDYWSRSHCSKICRTEISPTFFRSPLIAITLEFPNIQQELNYINEIMDKNPNKLDIDDSKTMNQIPQNTYNQEFEQAIGALSKITSRSPEEIKPHLEQFLLKLSSKSTVSKNHFFETATDDEWISAFRDWSESHNSKKLPVLSEEAMSRESIYPDRY